MTWSLGQANVSWNHRSEYLSAEEAAQVGGNLARERGALVVHGEQDAFDAQRRIERAANAHERVQQFGDAFERVIFALDRNEATASLATRAFSVSRSSAGGQSMIMNW